VYLAFLHRSQLVHHGYTRTPRNAARLDKKPAIIREMPAFRLPPGGASGLSQRT